MKLVAKNDFYNAPVLGIKFSEEDKKGELFRHVNHVHKGHRFNIGDANATYEQLDPKQKENVGLLLKNNMAVIDDKTNADLGVIGKIDREAGDELAVRKADALAAKNAANISLPAILKQLADCVALLSTKKVQ